MYYYDGATGNLKPVQAQKCPKVPAKCPLEDFRKTIEPYLIDPEKWWYDDCGRPKPEGAQASEPQVLPGNYRCKANVRRGFLKKLRKRCPFGFSFSYHIRDYHYRPHIISCCADLHFDEAQEKDRYGYCMVRVTGPRTLDLGKSILGYQDLTERTLLVSSDIK